MDASLKTFVTQDSPLEETFTETIQANLFLGFRTIFLRSSWLQCHIFACVPRKTQFPGGPKKCHIAFLNVLLSKVEQAKK